jgi:iron complex outermembrane recepter protein
MKIVLASTLLVCAVPLWGQTVLAEEPSERPVTVHIKSQPAAQALNDWAEQTGLQVAWSDEASTEAMVSGVDGDYTPKAALDKLLAHTDLLYQFVDSHTVTVRTSAVVPASNLRRASADNADEPDLAPDPVNSENEGPNQLSGDATESDARKKELQEVVVTGTHLRSEEPTSPLITLDQGDIERSGLTSTSELVRSLPQNFAGGFGPTTIDFGSTNTPANPSGASSANLRGLGPESTLTLINGHRLAYSDATSNIDLSIIPLPAIDHIDVLTDGASAVYGSDAVAGVVNVILKRSYDGIEGSAAFGRATDGGGNLQQYGIVAGKDWGAGSALISYQFTHQDDILASQRDFTGPEQAFTTLLPTSQQHAFFANLNQAISDNLTLNAQGLYSRRFSDETEDYTPYGDPGAVAISNGYAEQYGAVVGGTLSLDRWHVTLTGDRSHKSTDNVLGLAGALEPPQTYTTGLSQIELAADGPIWSVPGGDVNLAVGGSYRQETYASNLIVDIAAQRHVKSAYAEVGVPLLAASTGNYWTNSLSLTIAGRSDDYSDLGNSTVPKLGLVYRPSRELTMKGSWGRAFRAPSLLQKYGPEIAALQSVPDSADPTGFVTVLDRSGQNPGLRPEKAKTTTLNVSYSPEWIPGANISATYYDIDYRDRIGTPVTYPGQALIDPALSTFVTKTPTPAQLATALSNSLFLNLTGQPYDPAAVAAIIDARFSNVSIQRAKGADVVASYRFLTRLGQFEMTLNGTYLDLNQTLNAVSGNESLAGTESWPPHVRLRAGISWTEGAWNSSTFLNYAGSSRNEFNEPIENISSWTTVDSQIAYRFSGKVPDKGTRIALSVQNLFNKNPPYIDDSLLAYPGLHYDTTNASGVGRFVTLQVVTDW